MIKNKSKFKQGMGAQYGSLRNLNNEFSCRRGDKRIECGSSVGCCRNERYGTRINIVRLQYCMNSWQSGSGAAMTSCHWE